MFRDSSLTKDFLKALAAYVAIQAALIGLVWLLTR